MFKRGLFFVLGMITALVLTLVFQPLAAWRVSAQTDGCQLFPQTGKTVCGRFLQYWNDNGGLAQQGYPITETFKEVSDLDGNNYTVQYFERAVFEYHPENKPPYDVLLSQLGTFRFKGRYPNGEPRQLGPRPTVIPTIPVGPTVPPGPAQPTPKPSNTGGGTAKAGDKVEIAPSVFLTLKDVAITASSTTWAGTVDNESNRAFFFLLDKASLSVKDSNGKTYTNTKDTYCYPFNVPTDVQPSKSADVKLCTDYKPTSTTVDYVDLIIAKIGDAGPFTIRYTAP
ncbi:MAG: hypothetical protein QOH93_2288 [Chloroflexia bacterium]|jgi:hypothetical protein|nr:hypothetical protein [Chloroflexia bacterium]